VVRVPLGLLPLLLVFELAVVHDPAHGRLCLRGNLHQILICLAGLRQGFVGWHDAQLGTIRTDQPDRRYPDLLIYPCLLSFDR
jgi:hypothetical protein